jgi:hypothetical protein
MNKRNYRQVKRQKEDERKTRQLQKHQRRGERDTSAGGTVGVEPSEDSQPIARAPASEAR